MGIPEIFDSTRHDICPKFHLNSTLWRTADGNVKEDNWIIRTHFVIVYRPDQFGKFEVFDVGWRLHRDVSILHSLPKLHLLQVALLHT